MRDKCDSGTCAQARELYADDRIAYADYQRGLCLEHRSHARKVAELIRAAQSVEETRNLVADQLCGDARLRWSNSMHALRTALRALEGE